MKNENTSPLDFDQLICEYFASLKRQGPGSPEMTIKALSFMDNLNEISQTADLGCGTGGQTMVFAQNIAGNITGVDIFPDFINIFNDNAKQQKLQDRLKGVVGSIDNLSFQKEELDLIWSEGAIDHIGFEKGFNYWRDFLKKGGYIAVTNFTWFTDERPVELEKFYLEAIPEIRTMGQNISIIQKAGYVPVAAFTLPEKCWIDNYFIPQKTRQKEILEKYAGDKTVETFISNTKYQEDLYSKYKQHHGYVFYIGEKI